ncbi:MAG: N-(5'-phosphoribosyl)anthranilate isomerase [Firmicutes bacterium ADurb.Bin456]|nr:MAG: N-(5'-phosphoribosyl)anthranilate isomerase [Firmicutes bacterium ADurb.Bin456]
MGGVKVKICGLKREDDVRLCMKPGVDILGLVVEYPLPVPWNLGRAAALQLLSLIRPPWESCIVTGGSPDKVIELAVRLRPSMVQLHYKETLGETIIISESLRKLNIGVIKTIPLVREDCICQFGTADIEAIIGELCRTNVFGLLVDSRGPSNAPANGTALDPEFCARVINLSSKPVIIAGGINAGNVSKILRQTGAGFIDVMTGVESSPGKKEARSLSGLLKAIQSTGEQRPPGFGQVQGPRRTVLSNPSGFVK